MPRKLPSNPRLIQKGERLNPKGSSKLVRTRAAVKALTTPQVVEAITMLATSTPAEVFKIARDPKETFLRHWVAELAIKSSEKGDVKTFECLMNRAIGTPKQTVEVAGADGGAIRIDRTEVQMSVEEMQKKADELGKRRAEIADD